MRLTSSSDGRGKPLSIAIAEWAAGNPRVRRVWMVDGAAAEEPVELLAELQPAGDSEEALALWLANAGKWRRELQARLGLGVNLDWIDPDGTTGPIGETKTLVYAIA